MPKKGYLLKVLTVALLLSAVIIASAFSFALAVIDEAVEKANFIFSVIYSVAWVGIVLLANRKKLKTLQLFSAVYLGLTAVLFLIMIFLAIFTSIKLPIGLSLAVMLEVTPFLGWSHVIENSIASPIYCFVLTGSMAATVSVPLLKNLKKK